MVKALPEVTDDIEDVRDHHGHCDRIVTLIDLNVVLRPQERLQLVNHGRHFI